MSASDSLPEAFWIVSSCAEHLGQLAGAVDLPAFLRRQAHTRAVGAAALVAAAECRGRRPGGADQLRHAQARRGDPGFGIGNVGRAGLVNGRGQRVLPQQLFLRHLGAEVAHARAHVAVRQLVPGARESLGKGLRVVQETARDLLELGVQSHRQVGGQHGRPVHQAGHVRVGNDLRRVLGHPLLGTGGRLGQLPLELEEVFEEVVAPACRRGGPGDLQAAGDGVLAVAAAEVAVPAQTLCLQRRAARLRALVRFRCGAVCLAEAVAAGNQRDDLLVVHRHAVEGDANVLGRGHRVTAGVGAFGVDVDQPHVRGAQRLVELAVAGEALVGRQPGGLAAPVDVVVGFPHVGPAAAEAEGAKAHRLQRHVAGQQHQVGPADLLAVLLLDRPQQAARLVDVDVVGPAVQRREALLPTPAAAAAVGDAVGAGGVPGHADELRAVVAEVGGPPGL